MRLENKTALITGASRNIGAEVARTFAREGANLILNTRQSAEELETVAASAVSSRQNPYRHRRRGRPRPGGRYGSRGIDALGAVDVLVSNVAVRPHKPILEVSVDEWLDVMGTNLHSAFYLIRAVLPGMIEQRSGSIIAMGGQSAITGRPDTAIVTTAKTGLLGLIRAVAAECAQYGVRANLVNPGSTDTSRAHPEWYPEFQDVPRGSNEHLSSIPLGRQGTVQDIANACLFYASDESSYITGDRMNVVGGRYIV